MLLSFLTIYTHKKETGYFVVFFAAVSRWKTEAGRTTTTSHTHTQKKRGIVKVFTFPRRSPKSSV